MKALKMTLFSLVLAGASAASAQYYEEWSPTTVTTETPTYESNLKFRGDRKVGVGTQVGGTAGLLGLHLELNIEEQDSVVSGFGFGQGFSTFTVAWKRSYEGLFFTPYTTVGWSRWFNSASGRTPDSYMLEATLRSSEIEEGRFGIDYLVTSIGAQYNQLDGDLIGTTLFAEVGLFFAPERGQLMPSAAVGTTYFF